MKFPNRRVLYRESKSISSEEIEKMYLVASPEEKYEDYFHLVFKVHLCIMVAYFQYTLKDSFENSSLVY